MSTKKLVIAGVLSAVMLMSLASVFTAIGIGIGMRWTSQPASPVSLFADTAARSENVSFATGWISDGIEGLFVLDHQTGRLQCWIVNPRSGEIGGLYVASVGADLGLDKAGDGDYVISTGQVNFAGNARVGNQRPANSICYVGDGNSGKVVGYSLYYDQTVLDQAGAGVQQGELVPICRGLIREGSVLRDQ